MPLCLMWATWALVGRTRAKGGPYLVVGPDYAGDIPDDHLVLRTQIYQHWQLILVAAALGDRQRLIRA